MMKLEPHFITSKHTHTPIHTHPHTHTHSSTSLRGMERTRTGAPHAGIRQLKAIYPPRLQLRDRRHGHIHLRNRVLNDTNEFYSSNMESYSTKMHACLVQDVSPAAHDYFEQSRTVFRSYSEPRAATQKGTLNEHKCMTCITLNGKISLCTHTRHRRGFQLQEYEKERKRSPIWIHSSVLHHNIRR